MIGSVEFDNLINQLTKLANIAKQFNLETISLIKPLSYHKAELIIALTQSHPAFGLDKYAEINIQLSELFGININNDSLVVMDKNSFDTEVYNDNLKANELLILTKDSEGTLTISPEKIKDFAKRILNINYSNIDSDH